MVHSIKAKYFFILDISNILDTLFIHVGRNWNKRQGWREFTTPVQAKMPKVLLKARKKTHDVSSKERAHSEFDLMTTKLNICMAKLPFFLLTTDMHWTNEIKLVWKIFCRWNANNILRLEQSRSKGTVLDFVSMILKYLNELLLHRQQGILEEHRNTQTS